MGTSVYKSLLIKDLRRSCGEVERLRRLLKQMARELLEKQAQVAAIELVLRERATPEEIAAAPAIATTPKVLGLPWNRLTISVLSCLREANKPMPSYLITEYVADRNGLQLDDREDLVELQLRVKQCLKRLAARGRTVRLHSQLGNKYGVWTLPAE